MLGESTADCFAGSARQINIADVAEQLTRRILQGYRPWRDHESACDHNVPFDELTEEQFNGAARCAYEMLASAGRTAEAEDVKATYSMRMQ